ncbi:DUF3306 domain-containing protein [Shewanella sp. WXL01]|uniref:DUF3306 domain-containing protein n=1 Tax=Shewanella sp. WXL01 TaxID=2709721 RepID=UPI0014383EB3|nr:DUF3306 domain-containing protein [Shewanella sp. WXL01]NKF52545.1 DUF3306 domain-containing protein [Shewanella sp. WXL01]
MSGFLSRWQQRKEQVAKEADEQLTEQVNEQTAEQQALTVEQETQAEQAANETQLEQVEQTQDKVLTAEDLPDPESIEVGGSFASFMADNVDPAAKQAALKALWKQPQYNEIDGLLEYALDYTNQPKLSPEVSAELAKKVFRHVIKDEDKEEDAQEQIAADTDAETDETLALASDELDNLEQDNLELNQTVTADELNPMHHQSDDLVKHAQASDEANTTT